jgi:hypothetical protein
VRLGTGVRAWHFSPSFREDELPALSICYVGLVSTSLSFLIVQRLPQRAEPGVPLKECQQKLRYLTEELPHHLAYILIEAIMVCQVEHLF